MGVGHGSKASCWCRLNPSLRRIGAFTSRSETSQPEAPHRPIATAPRGKHVGTPRTCHATWHNPQTQTEKPHDCATPEISRSGDKTREGSAGDLPHGSRTAWDRGISHALRHRNLRHRTDPSPRHPVANMSAPHEPATPHGTTHRHKQKNHTPVQYLDERQRSTRTGPAAKSTPATLRTVETPGSGAPECSHRETNQLRETGPTRSGPAKRVRPEGITQTKADSQKSFVTRWET